MSLDSGVHAKDNAVPRVEGASERSLTSDLEANGARREEHGDHGSAYANSLNNEHSDSYNEIAQAVSTPYLEHMSSFAQVLMVLLIALSQFSTEAGLAMTVAPLQEIGSTLNTEEPEKLTWLPAAYSLTVGTFILPSGRWGDIFGYKYIFVAGYVWFAIWTLVTGFAAFSHNFIFFTFCRAMQGIGPALALPDGIAILTLVYPPGKKRSMSVSIFGGSAPCGITFGALVSGLFTQFVWWPWTYWFFAMLVSALCLLSVIIIPNVPGVGYNDVSQLDIVGSVLGVAGLILVNFAFNEGPASGWQKAYVYVLLIIGVLTLVAFFMWEKHYAKQPLIPHSAFNRVTNLVLAAEAGGWSSFGIWFYYNWQIFRELRHDTILKGTAQIVPIVFVGVIAAVITGILLRHLNPGIVMSISLTAFCVGTILLMTCPPDRMYWKQMFFSMLIMPFGMDMSFPAGVLILSEHLSKQDQGAAASLVNTVLNYSISIGLGFAGTIENHVNHGGKDLLLGYRGAMYFGLGVDGLALCIASILAVVSHRSHKAHMIEEKEGKYSEPAPANV